MHCFTPNVLLKSSTVTIKQCCFFAFEPMKGTLVRLTDHPNRLMQTPIPVRAFLIAEGGINCGKSRDAIKGELFGEEWPNQRTFQVGLAPLLRCAWLIISVFITPTLLSALPPWGQSISNFHTRWGWVYFESSDGGCRQELGVNHFMDVI